MIDSKPGNYPHVEWLNLKDDGVYYESVVLKRDELGNISFFQINSLDNIDKKRIARILSGRLAPQMECWDLLSQSTLNNGMNALAYFHPLVKVISSNGKIFSPKHGVMGTGQLPGQLDTRSDADRLAAAKQAEANKAIRPE